MRQNRLSLSILPLVVCFAGGLLNDHECTMVLPYINFLFLTLGSSELTKIFPLYTQKLKRMIMIFMAKATNS